MSSYLFVNEILKFYFQYFSHFMIEKFNVLKL